MHKDRLLLACGVIGPVLFVAVFLIEGATRVDYSVLQHPVNSLEIGQFGWMQRANFFITGGLIPERPPWCCPLGQRITGPRSLRRQPWHDQP